MLWSKIRLSYLTGLRAIWCSNTALPVLRIHRIRRLLLLLLLLRIVAALLSTPSSLLLPHHLSAIHLLLALLTIGTWIP